ncbi:MAG: hypothetical protein K9N46_15740 [Candidatus Marinimicrobia bacterium]|nr:hypothetical protein [Candidatus Neomarinimicrobiota bacterium]MCF7830274.1 hypothetical protein [Candidatus Neomarinimicrobiota bacterium]MCF7882183.1 hypothetical protein [Candidatus Neomarinimicrobiota bacterium]
MTTDKGWIIAALIVFGIGFYAFANGIQVFLNRNFRAPFSGKPVEGSFALLTGFVMIVAGVLAVGYSGYVFWTRIIMFL